MRDVAFDVVNAYGSGVETAVAVNGDDLVLEVHREKQNELHKRFGRAVGGYVQWQGRSSPQYGTGFNPKIAVSGRRVVEVHETAGAVLKYFVGNISTNGFRFGDAQTYGPARHPAVAITADGLVIGIEESGDASHILSYRLGTFATDGTLTGWKTTAGVANSGKRPIAGATGTVTAIAVNKDGTVTAIFQNPAKNTSSTVVGTLVGQQSITWGTPQDYGAGAFPSIALTDDGLVIATALSTKDAKSKDLFVACRVGQVNRKNKTIVFFPPRFCNNISNDIDPAKASAAVGVATNGNIAVETVSSQKTLGYAASLVQDRAHWMGDNLSKLGAKTLGQIIVPGSHDAAAYVIRDCSSLGRTCNSKTQISSIYGQLQAGARYFDIRPVYYKKVLQTGHFGDISDARPFLALLSPAFAFVISNNQGCGAAPLATVLADVVRFMKAGSREAVTLKFSHYYDRDKDVTAFDKTVMSLLVAAVQNALKDYLYVRPAGSRRLANTALNTLLAKRGIVLPVFDLAGAGPGDLGPGLYHYLDFDPKKAAAPQNQKAELVVYDKFADSNSLTTLAKDQLGKLKARANHGGDLFLYSWTLTQDIAQQFTCNDAKTFANDILTLATIADMALAQNITALRADGSINQTLIPNVIYLDEVSGFGADTAVWLNRSLYAGDTLLGDQRDHLSPGDSLLSAGNTFRLDYQNDGDLVLFNAVSNTRVRSVSKTKGKPAWRCVMQGDGNFVVYSQPYTPVFASDTNGNPGAQLKLTNSGKLQIFDRKGKQVAAPKLET